MSLETKSDYSFSKRIDLPYEEAIERTKAVLQDEGFGVMTEIDVRKTIKEKLGEDFRSYIILGACNPNLAYSALRAELEIGLMLPCNVIVYQDADGSVVAAQNPEVALGAAGNPALLPIASEARARLERAVSSLG